MKNQNSNIVVLQLVSLELHKNFTSSAIGKVLYKEKNLELDCISRRVYNDGKYSYNAFLTNEGSKIQEAGKIFGITFDLTEVTKEHERLFLENEQRQLQQKKIELSAYWEDCKIEDFVEFVEKRYPNLTITKISKEDYLKNGTKSIVNIVLQHKENYKKIDLSVDVVVEIYPKLFVIRANDEYRKNAFKRVKRNLATTVVYSKVMMKVVSIVYEKIDEQKRRINKRLTEEKEKEQQNKELGYEISTITKSYYSDYKRKYEFCKQPVVVLKKDSKKKEVVALKYNVCSEQDKTFLINGLIGKVKKDTLLKILSLLEKEALPDYNSELV